MFVKRVPSVEGCCMVGQLPGQGRTASPLSNSNGTGQKMKKLVKTHVLLEMTDQPDCRFVANWLTRAAEAQDFWSQALNEPDFADQTVLLHILVIPDLAAFALEILGKLENLRHAVALDLYPDEDGLLCIELTLLVQLGFFICVDGSYRMAVPETISLGKVKQAALDVLSTVGDINFDEDVVQPELLLCTQPQSQAEARRSRLIEMRNFNTDARYDRTVH
jgi:hypothetical protein